MGQHYNAFISYRHGPLDSKIAARVQKQLEHFRVPGAIAKATGIRRIDRVFRDKDELGLVGELNENIEKALLAADFLIVICSPATGESIWVQREIELFLKTHDRRHVLTVLADGEPADVVPEILQYEEMELEDEDGQLQTVKVPREALLCDYRMSPAKARKEELPRLAAALLGCSYDDLRQRQRRYRNTRIAAAGIAAGLALSGLAGYYAWSAKQIQENYWQSLYNQSTYLASEAQKQLESGDRLTAMLLALRALPEEEGDRPLVPAAVDALTEATNAYLVPGNEQLLLDRAFTIPGNLHDWFCDWERGYLVAQFDNKVSVRDLNTGKELFLETYENNITDVIQTGTGDLLVMTNMASYCYDSEAFTLLWQSEERKGSVYAVVCGDKLAMQGEGNLYLVDSATGKTIRSVEIPAPETESSWSVELANVSKDGRYVAAEVNIGYEEESYVLLWDLETDEMKLVGTGFASYHMIKFLPDGGLVITGEYPNVQLGVTYIAKEATWHFLLDVPMPVLCLELDGTVRWRAEVVYPQQYCGGSINTMTYQEKPAVLCAASNIAQVMDAATGEILLRVDFPEPIVHIRTKGENIQCVLQDGQVATYDYNTGLKGTLEAMVDEVSKCDRERDICVQIGSKILLYRWEQYDHSWQDVEQPYERSQGYSTKQGVLLEDKKVYRFYSGEDGKLLWTKELSEENAYWKLLGETASGDAILFYDGDELMKVSTADGEAVTESLNNYISSNVAMVNDDLYYYTSDTGEVVRIRDGQTSTISVPDAATISTVEEQEDGTTVVNVERSGRSFDEILPNPTGTEFLMKELVSGKYEYTLLTGEGELLPVEKPEGTEILWQPDGSGFLVKGATEILICDRQMAVLTRIPCEGMTVTDMKFYEDQLLVLYEAGKLCRYDRLSGQLLGTTELPIMPRSAAQWDASVPGELAILTDEDLILFDTESWQVQTHIKNCLGYVPGHRTVFARGYGEGAGDYTMGLFRLKDYRELMAMASEQLNGLELTEQQKRLYGIEE